MRKPLEVLSRRYWTASEITRCKVGLQHEILGISRQHPASVEAAGMRHGLSLELLFKTAAVLEAGPYLPLKFRLET